MRDLQREAFRLLFDEEKGKDGGKESDETEGGTRRFVRALFTTEPRCNIQEENYRLGKFSWKRNFLARIIKNKSLFFEKIFN